MDIPRLGVQSKLELPAYTTATATPNPSYVCDLHVSSRQPGSLSHGARPGIEPAPSRILNHNGNSKMVILKEVFKKYSVSIQSNEVRVVEF